METITFDQLSLSDELMQAIGDSGYTAPSPIQAQAIPAILAGHDIIGQAQTGTGKTAAFGIPLLEAIDASDKHVQAIVMCPTRELALQVCTELRKLAKYKKGLFLLPVYGGESIENQIKDIKRGVSVIVGTPGRIIDHLNRKTLKLDKVKMVVLDEADEMLNMGFVEDIETILSHMPKERQTVFFSATMPKPILELTKRYQTNPKIVKIEKTSLTVSNIEQFYYEVRSGEKMEYVLRILEINNFKLALVFSNTKRMVDEIVEKLNVQGHKALGIHGDLSQSQRNNVMRKFRAGDVKVLVATDVAARGIDVDDVDAVINYDLPMDDEYYVHRIGRTGRAGREGKSFTLVASREMRSLRDLMHYTKANIAKGEMPSGKELAKLKLKKLQDKLTQIIESSDLKKHLWMIEEWELEGLDMKPLMAALLKLQVGDLSERKEERKDRDKDRDREPKDRFDRNSKNDKGKDRDRRDSDKPKRRDRKSSGNMVRLFINLGKNHKVRTGDILGSITANSGLNGNDIGEIDVRDKFSYVEVPADEVNNVLGAMMGNQIKGKEVNIEVAK
ncbi:MAG: DEAD/DEAH box helicase [Cytophagales bacterium]|nr:MAG: DEAD/DEAH box helicase [Cytophagales bacterium]